MGLQYCKGILDRKSADNKLITVSMGVAWDNNIQQLITTFKQ